MYMYLLHGRRDLRLDYRALWDGQDIRVWTCFISVHT